MVHLLERRHNHRFKTFVDQFLPQRKIYRDELNQTPCPTKIGRTNKCPPKAGAPLPRVRRHARTSGRILAADVTL